MLVLLIFLPGGGKNKTGLLCDAMAMLTVSLALQYRLHQVPQWECTKRSGDSFWMGEWHTTARFQAAPAPCLLNPILPSVYAG